MGETEYVMKIYDDSGRSNEVVKILSLGRLLHGMCPACFIVYDCEDDDCGRKCGKEGTLSQGEAQQRIANLVKRAARHHLGLGLEVDCS